jgi:hypothetical protein
VLIHLFLSFLTLLILTTFFFVPPPPCHVIFYFRMQAEKEITNLKLRVDELTNTEFDLQRQLQEEQAHLQESEEKRKEGYEREVEMKVKFDQLCVAHDEINEAYPKKESGGGGERERRAGPLAREQRKEGYEREIGMEVAVPIVRGA